MIDNQSVGRTIAALRQAKGMTQQELAQELIVTHQAVSKWENGAALPDTQTLFDLSVLLGASIEQILTGTLPERASETRPAAAPVEPVAAPNPTPEPEPAPKLEPELEAESAPESEAAPAAPAARGDVDWEQVVRLAPFLSRDVLEQLVDRCVEQADMQTIHRLAPFIDGRKLGDLVRGRQIDMQSIRRLAPFLPRQILDELVLGPQPGAEAKATAKPAAKKDASPKNRIAQIALERGKWDWLEENISEVDDVALLAKIAYAAAEQCMWDILGEDLIGRLDQQDADAIAVMAAEQGEWDAIEEFAERLSDHGMAGLVERAIAQDNWDFLEEHADRIGEIR